jgi:small subunit ribosomal protein S20
MAQHKSAKKRARQAERRTIVNRARRSRIRSAVKKVESAIAGGDKPKAKTALRGAQPELDRAVGKGVLKRDTVARKMSRLSAQIHQMKS